MTAAERDREVPAAGFGGRDRSGSRRGAGEPQPLAERLAGGLERGPARPFAPVEVRPGPPRSAPGVPTRSPGGTVDNVIAVMETSHPHLSTQKSFYVEISRARHRAELVTDDRKALGEHLETTTGERVAALEALQPLAEGEMTAPELTAEEAGTVSQG